jgi:YgiT-type zinc finger domain-containing protein
VGGDEKREAFEREWAAFSEEVLSGMADWRAQHSRATLSEIEAELDARLAGMRARLLERVAQQSTATTWRPPASDQATEQEDGAPRCPSCGARLEPRGRHHRRLRTSGGQEVVLDRDYGVCPQCGQGLFPPG